jgi:hypothetical protein
VLEGSTAVAEHKDKDQAARSELLNHLSYAAIKNARLTVTVQEYSCVYAQRDDRVKVARGIHGQGSDVDMTMLESGISFLQMKASMAGGNRPHKVEAVAVAENLNSLIARFGRVRNQVEQSMYGGNSNTNRTALINRQRL